ncbi:TPA: hypothetical protein U2I65_003948 [Providencia stuartii]|nr:hypothetical protein [Providencia stuartii]
MAEIKSLMLLYGIDHNGNHHLIFAVKIPVMRDVQLEIKNVLAKTYIHPDPKKTNQLAEAIRQIIGSGNYALMAYVDNGLNKKSIKRIFQVKKAMIKCLV